MKLVMGADHAGFPLKQEVVAYLRKEGHEIVDLGAHEILPLDDYPDYAELVGEAIIAGIADRGILICGSGVGVCVAANKIPGIRASMCHDTYSAHQGVEHDEMNVLVLGARIIGSSLAYELCDAFLHAKFQGKDSGADERLLRRLKKVKAIEAKYMRVPV